MDENKNMEMRDVSRILEETVQDAKEEREECGNGESCSEPSLKNCAESGCNCGKTCGSNAPWPSLEGIKEDGATLKILSPAYAGDEGELTAVLQYVYQHILFENMGCKAYAAILRKIAVTEMKHLEILGEMILKLGALPVYSYLPPYPINYYCARAVSYSKSPRRMILDDIAAEQYAIETYTKIACRVKNERVAAVVQRIRADEEEHLSKFKCILKEMDAREK